MFFGGKEIFIKSTKTHIYRHLQLRKMRVITNFVDLKMVFLCET